MKKKPAGVEAAKQALRQQAEDRLAQSPDIPEALTPDEGRVTLHELRVHQIELEMQNEELRRAQEEIEAGRARYFDLYDLAPVGYCTLSEQGLILEANLTAAALLGTARGALVKQPISHFILKDDQDLYYLHRKKLFASSEPQKCELRLIKPDGAVFWAHLTATAAQTEDGAPLARMVLSDITERKHNEAKARYLTQVLLAIRNVNQLIVHEENPQQLIAQACRNLTETLGYHNAWIALIDGAGQTVAATASAGIDGTFDGLRQRLTQGEFPDCMRQALARDVLIIVHDPSMECPGCPLACDYGERAGLTRRLAFEGRTFGTLTVSVPAEFARDADAQSLFNEVASDLGFALHKIDLLHRFAQNEERMRLALKATNDVVWDWDIDHDAQLWNGAGEAVFGWTDIVETPQTSAWWSDRIHPEDRPRVDRMFQAAVGDPAIARWNDEYRFRKADGTYAFVVDRAYILRDAAGRAVRMIGAMLDLTERKHAEEALKASEIRFKELLLNVPRVAVQGYAMDGTVLYWNRASEAFYGYTAEEALARNLLDLIIPPAMHDGVRAAIRQMAETGESLPSSELELLRKDGSRIPVYSSHALLRLPGQPPEFFCIDIDLTGLKQTEAEKEKLQAQFFQAQKMESVGRLAGGVAHDFNNLLMAIMGYTDYCRAKVGSSHPIAESLDEIRKTVDRSANLTRQLLAFARKQTIEPRLLNLNDAVSGMLNLLRQLIGEGIALVWKPGANVWPIKVDPGQLDQILANLSVNARDAIGGVGHLAITTENVVVDRAFCADCAEAAPGDYVVLKVRDDGCGMDRETLLHIFDPFFTTKEPGRGTGLGLATVYGIVKQNGGFINVNSEPGKGTTFQVYLPRCRTAVEVSEDPQIPAPLSRGTETILLVEDEKGVRVPMARFLETQGYTVLTASDPGEALHLAAQHSSPIHLLLTDVVMPGMNGRDLAAKLTKTRPGMKCLFISGYTADVIGHHGILDEGMHFLAKPFTREVMSHKVRDVLNGASMTNQD